MAFEQQMKDLFEKTASWITPELENAFPSGVREDITVKAAMYSLMAGGKRIRPMMIYMSSKMLGLTDEDMHIAAKFALALELIHTYSLIHDDLPAMDNDDLRRGQPTCHKAYGEAIAILAGDALLNRAYEILFEITKDHPRCSYAASNMARLAGICGMIGGQSIDIASTDKLIGLDLLYDLQKKKTGALIECAVTTPYYLIGDPADDKAQMLVKLASDLGLMFQIRDDILDVTSSAEVMGKNTGKDERDDKATFVTLLGLEGAAGKLKEEYDSALSVCRELEKAGLDSSDYIALTDYLFNRDK
ncbi:MAG: polyprenyl synthetase family protein [Saccharofermentans sp.]|nr:polyprenyl synthetase family protein [Saccharofermentans sp.]